MGYKMNGPLFFKTPLKQKLMEKGSKITAEGKGTTGEGTWDKHGFGPHKKSILSKGNKSNKKSSVNISKEQQKALDYKKYSDLEKYDDDRG